MTLAILLIPVIAAVALLIFGIDGLPVFFCQKRPGMCGKPFVLYKFRTMHNTSNIGNERISDGDRMTRLGAFLRATSLDELPELWNIFIGDMSLVGPRPLLTEYLEYYSDAQARRHEIKPGLTGWAQVKGRNAITWEEKFANDLWYVDNYSLGLDMKILWMTLLKVLRSEGISQPGQATMEKFRGTGGKKDG